MRICHVNFARGFRGGERQTQILIESLAEADVQQILIARKDSPLHAKLAHVSGLQRCGVNKPYIKNIRLLRHLSVDLVHAHEAKAAQWALLNYCFNRTPYVLTRRMDRMPHNFSFTRAVYRKAAAVVGLSAAVRESIQKLVPGKEVTIIPSMYASLPANKQRVAELRGKYSGRFVIGHIGALVDRHKGQSVLIAAAQQLQSRYPEFVFLLLGAGEDEEMLRRLAAANRNVEFIGFVEDVGTWIEVFDLFVFPSMEEGLGSTLLDVMQHAKPVVASAVGGIPDIVRDRHSGLLVPVGDAEKLAAAIEQMYLNVALREECIAGGLEHLEHYSPPHIAKCYHDLYKSLLNR